MLDVILHKLFVVTPYFSPGDVRRVLDDPLQRSLDLRRVLVHGLPRLLQNQASRLFRRILRGIHGQGPLGRGGSRSGHSTKFNSNSFLQLKFTLKVGVLTNTQSRFAFVALDGATTY